MTWIETDEAGEFPPENGTFGLYRDCHIIRDSFLTSKFWKMFHLLKRMFSMKIVEKLILYRAKFLVEFSKRTNSEKIGKELEKSQFGKQRHGFDRNFVWTDSDPVRLNEEQTVDFNDFIKFPLIDRAFYQQILVDVEFSNNQVKHESILVPRKVQNTSVFYDVGDNTTWPNYCKYYEPDFTRKCFLK